MRLKLTSRDKTRSKRWTEAKTTERNCWLQHFEHALKKEVKYSQGYLLLFLQFLLLLTEGFQENPTGMQIQPY